MASSFILSFPTPTTGTYSLIAFNTGNQDLGFNISGVDNGLTLVPGEKMTYMVKPTGLVLADAVASGLLLGQTADNVISGQYYTYVENTTTSEKQFAYPSVIMSSGWENTAFDLTWLRVLPSGNYSAFNKNVAGVYSFPHNLQPSEVAISGIMSSNEKTIDYSITFPALKNEGSPDYAGDTDLPYYVKVSYAYPDNTSPYDTDASGFASGLYYGSGVPATGIAFSLPFYDDRNFWEDIPATYNFNINYNSAGTVQPGSTPLTVVLNHANIKENFFSDLTALASTNPKAANLHEVNTINIPADVITRNRLAIGIEDIKSVERVFKKDGVYVSNAHNLDFAIYTFSLQVDEYIPQYPNLNPNDAVKYYVEFNNGEWFRISPLSRDTEEENGVAVPKLLIFDTPPASSNSMIKYMDTKGIANNFRIKLVLDLSSLGDSVFVPPEINNYKCMIFDKEHFANFEE